MDYRDNKLAGEIKAMMCFAWESSTKYPYFSQWGELSTNDVNDIIWRVLSHKQSIHDAIIYVVGPALDQDILDILAEEDMSVTHYAGDFDIQWYSPAGEDFHLNIDSESFLSDFMFQAESFDVDEHVELWIESRGKRGVPNTVREIVEDAEAIQKKLLHVAERINKL